MSGHRIEHEVVIAGGGPTGLMLAAELALAGVDVAIVERRPNQDVPGRRAGGLHSRTLEILDQRGIADRFISEGQKYPSLRFHATTLDLTGFPTRHNYLLALPQKHFERIIAGWVAELPVRIYREREVTGFVQDDAGVSVAMSDGLSLRAAYLVGCDGGRSLIRKTAGIEFPGWDPTTTWLIAEVEMAEKPNFGIHHSDAGMYAIGPADDGLVGVVVTERPVGRVNEPTLRDLSQALVAVCGTDFGVHSPIFVSWFTDMTRQAATYRQGRVLLAGDAAHIHPPQGGQGLNIGVHDAVNLGWKLAQVVKGTSPESLLDTYHAERHPVAARVLRNTMAQVALLRRDDRTQALGEIVTELLNAEESRRRLAGAMSGLEIRYDLGEGHPLLGRRMPDLDLVTSNGPVRVYSLLHAARPVLINFGEDATYDGPWELPVIGRVPAPGAVRVRPDGYVAWVGESAAATGAIGVPA
ncbi:MAG TPA: FAD-dependent oxidoreductase [Gemmatimonadaceae bacterium]|nr:FAD-dependent oxidoreductase [Gemmatimonadaceae bacterium]